MKSWTCDHRDPGSISFSAGDNCFKCQICNRRLEITHVTRWPLLIEWIVVIAICALVTAGIMVALLSGSRF